MKKIYLLFLFLVIFAAFAGAHSIYLFNISLDFDKELKSSVIKEAQNFLKTANEPVAFDLDNGLIMVHFEPEQRNYVEINPLGYKVYGMRNENLKHKSGLPKITKVQGFEIANKFFNNLPKEIKSELKYNNDVSEVDGTYFYKWFRHVDGILVIGEELMINVDAVNGNIIAWRLSIFDYPQGAVETNHAVSMNVAKRVAELSFSANSVENFSPYLVISKNEPVWVNKLKGQFYPYYAGVSAKDGSIAFTGSIPGEVPEDYHAGDEMKIIETDFIKGIYNKK